MLAGTDTLYIYGQIIPGGYGAVVTERYARPKGLLLITVRKTYGKGNGHIVTETKRYASYADHIADNPQQTNATEMYGLQADTIVTHVIRNGTLQTYTFRLPVVTRVVNPQDGSIRITSRFASNGEIVSKTTDGDDNLVQLRRTYGQSDGSTVSRTEYPDGSWRQVRTRGEADGSVLRETTSGLPSLGSGMSLPPTNIPRPRTGLESSFDQTKSAKRETIRHAMPVLHSIVSGMTLPGTTPRPIFASGATSTPKPPDLLLASGVAAFPRPPRPNLALFLPGTAGLTHCTAANQTATTGGPLLCSGLAMTPPRPPRPTFASGVGSSPKPPVIKLVSGVAATPKPPILRPNPGARARLLCSGEQVTPPRPPRPILT